MMNLDSTNNKKRAGFTLIELMVVIVILGILAGLIVPRLTDKPDKARVVKAKMQIENLTMAVKQFKLDNGFYPSTEQGLKALVEKPGVGESPRDYPEDGYISKIPEDPWGNDYVYVYPGEHEEFDLFSLGADGEQGGEGFNADIGNWDLN
ncbi:MAG: type II secretion system major pseudopilin GspG [Desulfovermiculus sp.]